MEIKETELEGLYLLKPKVFDDNRGWFMESWNKEELRSVGIECEFVQDNHSLSMNKGILRGLHFQREPMAQTKLVRCTAGCILDVAVDIRKGSETYLKWYSAELSADNKKQLFIPKGFAHGFLTLTDNVEVQYKVDNYYSAKDDGGIIWNDPKIKVEWGIDSPILSEKDSKLPTIEELNIL